MFVQRGTVSHVNSRVTAPATDYPSVLSRVSDSRKTKKEMRKKVSQTAPDSIVGYHM